MNKEELIRSIILCVSVAMAVFFALGAVICFVLSAIQSVWFLALAFLCALCGGGATGVAIYIEDN